MKWYNKLGIYTKSQIDEAKKQFLNVGRDEYRGDKDTFGEGFEDVNLVGYKNVGLQSFNLFYDKYLNKVYESEYSKIIGYRKMAESTEIGNVIEDAVNESTQLNDSGDVMWLEITSKRLSKTDNITNNLYKEFHELFNNRININDLIWDLFKTFLVDGRLYYERIIKESRPSNGIIGIKKLPSETMDFVYDPYTGKIVNYYQYLGKQVKRPTTVDEALKRKDIVVFNPQQIGFIDYGLYGNSRYEIFGFLEKAKVPYNQLKLLETSIIIYRVVRAPERLVFKIHTGQMPRDKSLKFVEKVANKLMKKVSYDPSTGKLSQEADVLCIKEDTPIPLTDGRILTLREIVEEHEMGKENSVFTINEETLEFEEKPIVRAAITRRNENVIKVSFSNGEHIVSTIDHKFLVWDKSRSSIQHVIAGRLEEGMEVVCHNTSQVVSNVEVLLNRADCGCIEVMDNHNFAVGIKDRIFIKNSMLDNFFIPTSSDGSSSDITSVGGNAEGFKNLDDLYHFQRKLYQALKYPLSRIDMSNEGRSSDILFGGGHSSEIVRDEIKWAKFLERQQRILLKEFKKLFLLHLEFRGLQKAYGITDKDIEIKMTPPSNYHESMRQGFLEMSFNNYNALANNEEFSKYWLMKRFLHLTDEEIKDNVECLKKDKELFSNEESREENVGGGLIGAGYNPNEV